MTDSKFFIGIPSGFNTTTFEPSSGSMGTTLEKQSLLGWDITKTQIDAADAKKRVWE
jgi:hypothetical protein